MRITAPIMVIAVALTVVPLEARAASAARAASTFGDLTVEAQHFQGAIGGAWEFSKGVVVTGKDIKVTCDRLQVWPTKAGRELEKAEATGNVVVSGRYVAADGTEWKVRGTAAAASYDQKAGQGVMRGNVSFTGTNQATGAVVTVAADKLLYLVKTREFRFERGVEPVRVRWEEAAQAAGQAGGGTIDKTAEGEGGKAQEGAK